MSARSPRSMERVIYRGGWELSYRCAVSPTTIDVLKDLGWEVVTDKAVQRLVFVQITVYERWEPSYQFRLHAQQPDDLFLFHSQTLLQIHQEFPVY